MNAPAATGDSRFDELVARFLESLDRGKTPDRAALLAAAPDLADRLRSFFADHDRLDRAVGARPSLEPVTDAYAGPVPAPDTMVKYVGDYELLNELARGGMGVVYRARQRSLDRVVALKMILRSELARSEERYRFKQEAESAASLDHPNIVPIFEVGEHDGQPYFSMKLIDGVPLGRWRKNNPPRGQIVAILVQVADAIDHTHPRGVLHRDLKPGNILVSERLGVGPPCLHVTDFGLAKRMTTGGALTQSGDKLGTPAYLAPEQLENARGVTTAVDVWALGVVMHESLTGQKPFTAEDPIALFRQIAEHEPTPPRTLTPDLDRDLETIILKCLEKAPAKRYSSVGEVAAELRRWLNGEPIQARPVSQVEKVWRWCRRHPAISGLTAAVAGTFLVATVVALALAQWGLEEKRKAGAFSRAATDNPLRALEQADHAESVLARSFLRPFKEGLWDGPQASGVDAIQLRTLWELAENRGARVGFQTIDQGRADPLTTRQLVGNSQVLLHAAVGLDLEKRDRLAARLGALLRDQDGRDRRTDVAFLLVSLGGLDGAEATRVASHLHEVVARKMDDGDGLLVACADALRVLADRMDAVQASRAADLIATALERIDRTVDHQPPDGKSPVFGGFDYPDVGTLDGALEALAPRLSPDLAQALASLLAQSLSDWTLLHSRTAALLALADRLPPPAACAVRQQCADRLLAALEREDNPDRLAHLAEVLRPLAWHLPPDTAGKVRRQPAHRLLTVMEQGKQPERAVPRLADDLAALVDRLTPADATLLGQRGGARIVAALERETDAHRIAMLAQGQGKLTARLEPATAVGLAARVQAALEREMDASKLDDLAQALATLAPRLDPAAAALVCRQGATRVLAKLEQETNVDKVYWLAQALDALAARLDPAVGAPVCRQGAERILAAMTREQPFSNPEDLAQALAMLAARLDPASGAHLCQQAAARLAATLEQEKGASSLGKLAQALATLAARLDPNQQDAYVALALLAVSSEFMTFDPFQNGTPEAERIRGWLHRPSPALLTQRLGSALNWLIPHGGLTPAVLGVNMVRAAEPFPARFSDEFMVAWLQRPIGVGPWRGVILDVLGTKHRRHFRDPWDYVRFAQERGLSIDFTAGPQRHLPESPR